VRLSWRNGLDTQLLALGDRLFAGEGSGCVPLWRSVVRYVVVSTLIATIIIVRRLDAVTNPQFYGEDGFIFFHDDVVFGASAIGRTYMGFPYLALRLIGMVGGMVPFAEAPRVYTTAAILITALSVASFSLPAFDHVVRSNWLRILWCIVVACLPFDDGRPVRQLNWILSSPQCLGWWLAIWLSLLSVIRLPRRWGGTALVASGGIVAIFTTPIAVVNAPLWLLRAWYGIRRSRRRDAVYGIVLVAALVMLLGTYPALGMQPPGLQFPILSYPLTYVWFLSDLIAYRTTALVVPPGVVEALVLAGRAAIATVALGVLALLLALAAAGRWRSLPVLAATLYTYFGAWVLSTLGRLGLVYLPVQVFHVRYALLPSAMLGLAFVAALDGLPAGRVRSLCGAALAMLLVWAWSPRFILPPFDDQEWPRWAAALDRKIARKSRAPLTIPINPAWTPIVFDPLDHLVDAGVPSTTILTGLGTHGTFRQQFVSSCDGLMAVEVSLAAPRSEEGSVLLSLLDATGQVLATDEVLRADLPLGSARRGLVFDPVPNSRGKVYTLAIQAVKNRPEATIYVLGTPGDPYPHGRASIGKGVVEGDASFGYECSRPPPPGG